MKAALALVLLAAAGFLAGCSDAFDPFVESDRTFALYGFLDARQDTQFVRVESITGPLEPGGANIRVTSTELETGTSVTWTDSTVALDDGTTATAFFAAFRPEPGRGYRIEAARSDAPGAVTEAVVAMPAEPSFSVEPPTVFGENVSQRLVLESAASIRDVRVRYTVQRLAGGGPTGGPEIVEVNYPSEQSVGGAATILVAFTRDARTLRTALGVPADDSTSVALLGLDVAYAVLAPDPGVVTGGVGVVGAAAAFRTPWTLGTEFVEVLRLIDAQVENGPRAVTIP